MFEKKHCKQVADRGAKDKKQPTETCFSRSVEILEICLGTNNLNFWETESRICFGVEQKLSHHPVKLSLIGVGGLQLASENDFIIENEHIL